MTDLPEPVRVNGEYEYAYTATQMRDYRNAALEEAAKVCDGVANHDMSSEFSWASSTCASAIRALKEQK